MKTGKIQKLKRSSAEESRVKPEEVKLVPAHVTKLLIQQQYDEARQRLLPVLAQVNKKAFNREDRREVQCIEHALMEEIPEFIARNIPDNIDSLDQLEPRVCRTSRKLVLDIKNISAHDYSKPFQTMMEREYRAIRDLVIEILKRRVEVNGEKKHENIEEKENFSEPVLDVEDVADESCSVPGPTLENILANLGLEKPKEDVVRLMKTAACAAFWLFLEKRGAKYISIARVHRFSTLVITLKSRIQQAIEPLETISLESLRQAMEPVLVLDDEYTRVKLEPHEMKEFNDIVLTAISEYLLLVENDRDLCDWLISQNSPSTFDTMEEVRDVLIMNLIANPPAEPRAAEITWVMGHGGNRLCKKDNRDETIADPVKMTDVTSRLNCALYGGYPLRSEDLLKQIFTRLDEIDATSAALDTTLAPAAAATNVPVDTTAEKTSAPVAEPIVKVVERPSEEEIVCALRIISRFKKINLDRLKKEQRLSVWAQVNIALHEGRKSVSTRYLHDVVDTAVQRFKEQQAASLVQTSIIEPVVQAAPLDVVPLISVIDQPAPAIDQLPPIEELGEQTSSVDLQVPAVEHALTHLKLQTPTPDPIEELVAPVQSEMQPVELTVLPEAIIEQELLRPITMEEAEREMELAEADISPLTAEEERILDRVTDYATRFGSIIAATRAMFAAHIPELSAISGLEQDHIQEAIVAGIASAMRLEALISAYIAACSIDADEIQTVALRLEQVSQELATLDDSCDDVMRDVRLIGVRLYQTALDEGVLSEVMGKSYQRFETLMADRARIIETVTALKNELERLQKSMNKKQRALDDAEHLVRSLDIEHGGVSYSEFASNTSLTKLKNAINAGSDIPVQRCLCDDVVETTLRLERELSQVHSLSQDISEEDYLAIIRGLNKQENVGSVEYGRWSEIQYKLIELLTLHWSDEDSQKAARSHGSYAARIRENWILAYGSENAPEIEHIAEVLLHIAHDMRGQGACLPPKNAIRKKSAADVIAYSNSKANGRRYFLPTAKGHAYVEELHGAGRPRLNAEQIRRIDAAEEERRAAYGTKPTA